MPSGSFILSFMGDIIALPTSFIPILSFFPSICVFANILCIQIFLPLVTSCSNSFISYVVLSELALFRFSLLLRFSYEFSLCTLSSSDIGILISVYFSFHISFFSAFTVLLTSSFFLM